MLDLTSSASASTLRHPKIPSLDGLRAISVLLVVAAHCGFDAVPGGLGVTTFFFLSGFLITTLMLQERARTGHVNVVQFYLRRMFRLYPPLICTLALAYGLTYLHMNDGGLSWKGLAAQLGYLSNYYHLYFDIQETTVPGGTGILWSLAVEEHFYLIYPFLFLGLTAAQLRDKTTVWVLLAICLLVLAWRLVITHFMPSEVSRIYYATDTRVDAILFGCAFAFGVRQHTRVGSEPPALGVTHWCWFFSGLVLLALTLVWRDENFRSTWRYSLQGLALAPLFYMAIFSRHSAVVRWLNHPALCQLGVYSYGIYLSHYICINIVRMNTPSPPGPVLMFCSVCIMATLFAAAIDRWVDPKFKALRHRFG